MEKTAYCIIMLQPVRFDSFQVLIHNNREAFNFGTVQRAVSYTFAR